MAPRVRLGSSQALGQGQVVGLPGEVATREGVTGAHRFGDVHGQRRHDHARPVRGDPGGFADYGLDDDGHLTQYVLRRAQSRRMNLSGVT